VRSDGNQVQLEATETGLLRDIGYRVDCKPQAPMHRCPIDLFIRHSLVNVNPTSSTLHLAMSGLEPLVALGLACNVFQIVSFAREVCQVSKTVLETGDVPPPALASTLDDLVKVFRDVESTTAASNASLTSRDRELVKIANECSGAAAAMKQELDKTQATLSSGKGRWSGSWVAVKAVAGASSRKKKLEKLEQLVETHQKALETRLLANIW
jgi:hypothetical protein